MIILQKLPNELNILINEYRYIIKSFLEKNLKFPVCIKTGNIYIITCNKHSWIHWPDQHFLLIKYENNNFYSDLVVNNIYKDNYVLNIQTDDTFISYSFNEYGCGEIKNVIENVSVYEAAFGTMWLRLIFIM